MVGIGRQSNAVVIQNMQKDTHTHRKQNNKIRDAMGVFSIKCSLSVIY